MEKENNNIKIYADLENFKFEYSQYTNYDYSRISKDFPCCKEIEFSLERFKIHFKDITVTTFLSLILQSSHLVRDQIETSSDIYLDFNSEDLNIYNIEILEYLRYENIGWALFMKAKKECYLN